MSKHNEKYGLNKIPDAAMIKYLLVERGKDASLIAELQDKLLNIEETKDIEIAELRAEMDKHKSNFNALKNQHKNNRMCGLWKIVKPLKQQIKELTKEKNKFRDELIYLKTKL